MKPETLFDAMRVLADAHTRTDDRIGFTVETYPASPDMTGHSSGDYVEAWRIVRQQLHLPTKPE